MQQAERHESSLDKEGTDVVCLTICVIFYILATIYIPIAHLIFTANL